ncbi:hypothetical protein [Salarchaeum japonicum]|uniref:Uncharacterized protein n=1 Tax=Salarchaeum japonicum TaxID=555573 RepID=A0AAV3T1F4_9EURY|nr:hypothetical protein [Salarchaeum japonicum]
MEGLDGDATDVTLAGWLIAVGLVALPVLFGYAYWRYRRGDRNRKALLVGVGAGGVGWAGLLLQAEERWLASPWDDAAAVLAVASVAVGFYALYLAYWREPDADGTG